MHREAGWFVDHDQVLVFKEHIEIHRLRLQVGQRLWRRHPQLDFIAGAQGRLGPAGGAIDPHIAGFDEFLNPRAALLRPLANEPTVEAHGQGLGVVERQQLAFPFTKAIHGSSRAIGPNTERR